MTKALYPDRNAFLPFAPGDLDRCGLRLTRAEFSRLLEVSKQAVGEWVTSGKITLGADGRLDPRQAVSQLLRNSDPARLRAKVLEPLARDIGRLQQRVVDLEAKLSMAKEDAEFHEEASLELIDQWQALDEHLVEESAELARLPADKVVAAVIAWMRRVTDGQTDAADLALLDFLHTSALPSPDIHPGALAVTTKGGADG